MTNITTTAKKQTNLVLNNRIEKQHLAILKAAESKNTSKTYQNALNAFGKFVIDTSTDIDIFKETISEPIMKKFISWMGSETWNRKKKDGTIYESGLYFHKTITTYVYAINTYQAEQGLNKPVTDKIKKYLIGAIKEKNKDPKQAKAIEYDDLTYIAKNMDTITNKGKRDKALLLIGFFGCLRRSEISTLQLTDTTDASGFISFDNDGLYITLKKHKTNKDGKPIVKYISRNKNPNICPIVALQSWLNVLEADEGNVFVRVHKSGSIQKAKKLTDKAINNVVKNYFGKEYSGHSLRVGFAVAAYERDASMDAIRIQGGWKSMTMPTRYAEQADRKKNSATNVF